uniref:GATA-type domain-containing protein n=1 Tax=Strigamia maritima TaxID=126957 RepID=T1J6Q7_STRMM
MKTYHWNMNPLDQTLRNYQFCSSSFVIPLASDGGFTATHRNLFNANLVPRALFTTLVLPFDHNWSNPVDSSTFLNQNDHNSNNSNEEKIPKANLVEKKCTKKSTLDEDKKLKRISDENEKLKSVSVKSKRKQGKPTKCLPFDDPNFRGVTINMQIQLKKEFQSKLVIRHTYSGLCQKSTIRRQRRQRFLKSNFDCKCASDDKQCASCGTAKTPLWRDAEDGTPLCNACGIRYKKYRIRCNICWRIPRKDRKSRTLCYHPVHN